MVMMPEKKKSAIRQQITRIFQTREECAQRCKAKRKHCFHRKRNNQSHRKNTNVTECKFGQAARNSIVSYEVFSD